MVGGRGQRGLAMIMVLWSMMLLALLAGSMLQRSTTDLQLARNLASGIKAELAADAGARLAIAGLVSGTGEWGEPRSISLDGARITVSVTDEAGRVDLNAAPPELLRELMVVFGLSDAQAAALADAIADFRDADTERRPFGAEDRDYAAAGAVLGARDAPFAATAELGRVLGMPPELRRALMPHVTVHSGLAEPVAASASPQVLAALAELAEQRDQVGQGALPTGRLLILTDPEGGRRHWIARILSEALLPDGARFAREAVVEVSPDRPPHYRVLSWERRW